MVEIKYGNRKGKSKKNVLNFEYFFYGNDLIHQFIGLATETKEHEPNLKRVFQVEFEVR